MDFGTLNPDTLPIDFQEFAHHCAMLSAGRALPRQQDFHRADVSWLRDRLYEVDVLDCGPDYYFRKFGMFWHAIYSEDFTGRWLSELELRTSKLDALRVQFDSVVSSCAPLANRSRLIWPSGAELAFDRLLIPFTLDGGTVSEIVVAAHFDADAEDVVFSHGEGLPRLVVEESRQFVLALAS